MKGKRIIIISILALLIIGTSTALAIGMDVNIFELSKDYFTRVVQDINANSTQQLEQEKSNIETETRNYIESYKAEINNELEAYASEQINLSKGELNNNYSDLKKQLEESKKQIIDQYKTIIQDNINSEKIKKDKELKSDINTILNEEF
jgi:ABC-type phosphate transport system auxiliary subunit